MGFVEVNELIERIEIMKEIEWGIPVKNLRNKLELTQKELGDVLGLSKETVCKIEQNRRNLTFENYVILSQLAKMIFDKEFLSILGLTCENCKLAILNDKEEIKLYYQTLKKYETIRALRSENMWQNAKIINLDKEVKRLTKELEFESKLSKKYKEDFQKEQQTRMKYQKLLKEHNIT